MARSKPRWNLRRAAVLATAALASGVVSDQILTTSGFANCNTSSEIRVEKVDIKYNKDRKEMTFNVAGTSSKSQNVTATLSVTAYGKSVYNSNFNPCKEETHVEQLCPVPGGTFSANGSQVIPEQYANSIPSIAFMVPDIAAMATLQLKALDTGEDVGCITSEVTNGKTASVPAVSFVAAGIAGAALIMTGVTAFSAMAGAGVGGAGATAGAGVGTVSPSFSEVFGVFQGFAMNGMMSVSTPAVYRSFCKNFAFSTGLVSWTSMQRSIDSFRNATGGNLTHNNVDWLHQATLVYPDGSTKSPTVVKRGLEAVLALSVRDIETSLNASSTAANATSSPTESSLRSAVSGVEGFVETLTVPSANAFMTILLIVSIIIGVIIVGILLVKVILETWALFGQFPEKLKGFREHYWMSIARTITSLILLLYGIWVLYCIYQFVQGDSYAAKALAGVSLGIFTAVLAFFSFKIYSTVHKLKKRDGDLRGLYDDKDLWIKYSLFYESYKKSYWWLFVPVLVYLFAKGVVMALGDGHGMAQTISQFCIEALMLGLLVWSRPYERKSGNVVNIMIQTVRVLSVACIFIFVEEFGIAETTQTVTGVILIVIQSLLTGVLACLIAYNAIVACVKENPHRKRRKELEKLQRDMDTLTPLDASNAYLRNEKLGDSKKNFMLGSNTEESKPLARNVSPERNQAPPDQPFYAASRQADNSGYSRPGTPLGGNESRQNLVMGAAPIEQQRQPTLPHFDFDLPTGASSTAYTGYSGAHGGGETQGGSAGGHVDTAYRPPTAH